MFLTHKYDPKLYSEYMKEFYKSIRRQIMNF